MSAPLLFCVDKFGCGFDYPSILSACKIGEIEKEVGAHA